MIMDLDYIFIFSSGMKTGSTLIQRYLNSHKDILIWGENIILDVIKEHERFEVNIDEYKEDFEVYINRGYDNHLPRLFLNSSNIRKYMTNYIENILKYNGNVIMNEKKIFGFKQVWYTCDYILLLEKYLQNCNKKFIYITRNIIDCYLSCKKGGDPTWINYWVDINMSFLKLRSNLNNIILFKYEDIIKNSFIDFCEILSNFLEIPSIEFDINVFNNKLGSSGVSEEDRLNLSEKELKMLFSDNVIECCRELGYDYNIYNYLNRGNVV